MAADVGYIAAFAGGVVSFLSPCVLPIVPAYLALIGGVSVTDLREGTGKVRALIVRDTALFVAGFSAVFVLLGLSITALGGVLFRNQALLTQISGALLIAMAALLLASQLVSSTWLQVERRFHPRLSRYGIFAAPLAGVAFGFGWTPCIGPVLASVLVVASASDRAIEGGLLLALYSLGLGVPFLLTGIAFGRVAGTFNWLKQHSQKINIAAACALALFGALLVAGRFSWLTIQLQDLLKSIGLDRLITLG